MVPEDDDTEPLVDLVIEEPGWESALPDLDALAHRAAEAALKEAGADPDRWTLCLLACSDDRIAGLNAEFRGKPAPTNVLSWPAFDAPLPHLNAGDARVSLGDVALALQTTLGEAKVASIPLKDHATHLIIHGCLHLLGFDHETDAEADVMEAVEVRALCGLGIPDPYNRRDAQGVSEL
jgi:probable rRNA maturation factor